MDPGTFDAVDRCAMETGFSGVVRVDVGDESVHGAAYGLAHRGWGIPVRPDTRFQVASGAKGFTALVVASLVEEGRVALDTRARSLLGGDLPLVDDDVTVAHLLAHTSGIGDYLDEGDGLDLDAYLMPVPVQELACAEDYLAVLDGHPQAFRPGERFAYCNAGYVVLALLAERAAGLPFPDLVHQRVCRPAGLADTAFLRNDESHERRAEHYLDATGPRTSVLHLPVLGVGDGGLTTTAPDLHAFWRALFADVVVAHELVTELTKVRTRDAATGLSYGLGFWRERDGPAVLLEGHDAGMSFRSAHDPTSGTTATVLANTTDGAWPVARELRRALVA